MKAAKLRQKGQSAKVWKVAVNHRILHTRDTKDYFSLQHEISRLSYYMFIKLFSRSAGG